MNIEDLTLRQLKQLSFAIGLENLDEDIDGFLEDLKQRLEVAASPSATLELKSDPSFSSFLVTGKNYLIRTFTMIYCGKLINQSPTELLLSECSWIAETDRWSDSLNDGDFNEVEPYPNDVILLRSSI
ncbi:MAG: hypothetical protein ACRC62_20710, partial [Microcoleus sp.]